MLSIFKAIFSTNLVKQLLLFTFIFIFVFALSLSHHTFDYDLFSRLIMGKHVAQTGSVMYQDIFSYTPTHTWYDHEWFSSYLFYVILEHFGANGLIVFKVFLSSLLIFFIHKDISLLSGNNSIKLFYIITCILVLFTTSCFYSLRCQDFTFVFITILIYLLERIRLNYNSKTIYIIPILILIWLNCHGGAMFGLAIIFLYGFGSFLNKAPYMKFFIILLPSVLVYLINPWGASFIKFMISAIFVDRHLIGEWQTPFSMDLNDTIKYIVILIVFISTYTFNIIKCLKKCSSFDWVKCFILVLFLILSLRYIKHTFVFDIMILIYLYTDLLSIVSNIASKINNSIMKSIKAFCYIVCIFVSLFLIYQNPIAYCWQNKTYEHLPLRPLNFLILNNIKGRILSDYYCGAFIAYKHYPDFKIYMDGRQEQVYDYKIFSDLMGFLFYDKVNAHKILGDYNPDILLIDKYWIANGYLFNQNYYSLVYEDDQYFVYLAPNVQKKVYTYPEYISIYNSDNFFDTNIDFTKDD